MAELAKLWTWVMSVAGSHPLDLIVWWEQRRVVYNWTLLAFGLVMWPITCAHSRDCLATPLIVVLLVFCSNVWYTGGWIVHLALLGVMRSRVPSRFGPVMLIIGTLFSFCFIGFFIFAFPD